MTDSRPTLFGETVATGDTVRVLEVGAVMSSLASLAETDAGRRRVRGLEPSSSVHDVEERHSLVSEAGSRARDRGSVDLAGFSSMEEMLATAGVAGTILDPDALLRVAGAVRVARKVRRHLSEDPERFPRLAEIAARTPDLGRLGEQIEQVISDDGEVRDDASVDLARIRRRQRRLRSDVRRRLEKLAVEPRLQKVLRESLVTERGGRLVLMVRVGQRDGVQGVVHDTSASGQTLFVEPLAVVDAQNTLAALDGEERHEVARLLAELTAHVRAATPALGLAEAAIAEIDALQAIGRYSERTNGTIPRVASGGIRLRRARHPLMDPAVVELRMRVAADVGAAEDELERAAAGADYVPLDLELEDGRRALVITGPNTGGKTVVLKTIGLIAYLNQCGIPVPADDAAFPVFPRIHADIGDEQSIVASLSTFSGHLNRVLGFLADCPPESLVLIDEMGTGTDPTEGSALGIALLERFQELGALCVVSTHHDALKAFAHGDGGAINAAMEFDIETLTPTYRLRVGRPGRSNALEIASRLGLDETLVSRARSLLGADTVRLDTLLQRLEEETDEVVHRQQGLETERGELHEAVLRHSEAERKLREVTETLRRDGQEAIRAEHDRVRRLGEEKLVALEGRSRGRESKRAQDDRRARWGADVGTLGTSGASVDELASDALDSARDSRVSSDLQGGRTEADPGADVDQAGGTLRRGDPVIVAPFGLRGTVCVDWDPESPEAGDVEVDVRGKRFVVARGQVGRASGAAAGEARPLERRSGGTRYARRRDVPTELHIRRLRVEEALTLVDKYIDDALLAEHVTVRVVHGYGTGTLRRALHEWLSGRPGVVGFALAGPGEGGGGVTVVRLEV